MASSPVHIYNIHLPHKDSDVILVLDKWADKLAQEGVVIPRRASQSVLLADNIGSLNTTPDVDGPQVKKDSTPYDTIVLGDFNLPLDKPQDSTGTWKKVNVRSYLMNILHALKLAHIPISMSSTHATATRGSSIIDHICIPKEWFLRVRSFDVVQWDFSDHSLLSVDLLIGREPFQHPPYWRFKNQLLADDHFVQIMSHFLREKQADMPSNQAIHPWWDNLKAQIILISKRCWSQRSRIVSPGYVGVQHGQLSSFRPQKIYFIRDSDGNIQSDPLCILDILADYYQSLYTPLNKDALPPNLTFGLKRISLEQELSLETPITAEELKSAADQMNISKAPGRDGLTLEFYLKFWDLLIPMFLMWCKQTFILGKLTGLSSKGVISLICKKGDSRDLYNWRPITLISVDVKIISKALAIRILPVISSIIPSYQNGLPGRSIHSSLAITRDIISICASNKEPLYILTLDQAKAFDRVNHQFLFHLLSVIGLPVYIISAIKAIYSGYCCSVKNVSTLSREFSYCRGVRQGDPISTALYTLAIQPALNAIQLVLPYEGFLLSNGSRLLLSAYADDVTLFLNSRHSVASVIAAFKAVGAFSEADLNLYKSALAAFNLIPAHKMSFGTHFLNIPVSFEYIIVLGIAFTPFLRIYQDQWNHKIQASRDKILSSTSHLKNLSYIQRAQWCSKVLWPSWTYILKTLQPTATQISQLSLVFSEAVWLGGKHWLPLHDLYVHKDNGGLSMLSVQDKIDVFRVIALSKLLVQGPPSILFIVAEQILNTYAGANLGFRILHSIPNPNVVTSLPSFYQAAFLAWDRFPMAFTPSSLQCLMSLPVFNSKFLAQQDPPIIMSSTQASSFKAFTIDQFLKLDKRPTRQLSFFKTQIRLAVDQWVCAVSQDTTVPSKPSVLHREQGIRHPYFLLNLMDTLVPLETWNNKLLLNFLQQGRDLNVSHEVPTNTWKILASAQSPNTHKNQYWRFLHRKVPTPLFYHHLGLLPSNKCILCPSSDTSYRHQFIKCTVLRRTVKSLEADIKFIGLPPLLDLNQLYPLPTTSCRLANILVIAFMYTVILLSRCAVNTGLVVKPLKFLEIYRNVIAKHVVFFARVNPPSNLDARFCWLTLTHMNLVAYFQGDQLFIRTATGFKKYSEKTFSIESA